MINYEDSFFLKEDWVNDDIICEKNYHFIVLFFLKYPDCGRELKYYLKNITGNQDKFPLFLLLFRYFSSDILIKNYNLKNNSLISDIQKCLNNELILLFKKREINKSLDWCGLYLDEFSDLINPKIKFIKKFLEIISEVNFSKIKEEFVFKIYKNIILDLCKHLVKLIFEGKINEIFKAKFNDLNEFKVIINIYNVFEEKLKKEFNEKIKNFPIDFLTQFRNIHTIFIDKTNNYNKIDIELIDAIKDDYKKEIENQRNKKLYEEKNSIDKKLTKITEDEKIYSDLLKYLKTLEVKFTSSEFQECCQKAYDLYKIYEKDDIFVKNSTNKFSFKLFIENKTYYYYSSQKIIVKIKRDYESFSKNEFYIFSKNCELCVRDGELKEISLYIIDEEKIKKKIHNLIKEKESLETNIDLFPIEVTLEISGNKVDIDDLNADFTILNLQKMILEIKNFFKKISSQEMDSIVEQLKDKQKKLDSEKNENKIVKFQKDIDDYNNKIKNFIDEAINQLNELRKKIFEFNFQKPSFHNIIGSSPRKTEEVCKKIDKFKREFLHIFDEINKNIDIYENYKNSIINGLNIIGKKFNLNTKKLIKFEKPIKFAYFKTKFSSSPYISLSNQINNIDFSFKTLDYKFGPIIPSLYSNNNFKLNIVSFVNKKLKARFENEEQLKNNFKISKSINPLCPIQITYSYPSNTCNEDCELNYNGIIKINDEKEEYECKIKFNFIVNLIHLRVIFESSEDLIFEEGYFKFTKKECYTSNKIFFKIIIPETKLNSEYFCDKYYLINDEDNEVDMPIIKYNNENNSIVLIIPNIKNKNQSKMKGDLNFCISETLIIPIKLNFTIKLFEYRFESYDSILDKFDRDYYTIYLYKNLEQMTIYFRVFFNNNDEEHSLKIITPKGDHPKYYIEEEDIKTKKNKVIFKVIISNFKELPDRVHKDQIKIIVDEDEFNSKQLLLKINKNIKTLKYYLYNINEKKIEFTTFDEKIHDGNIKINPFSLEKTYLPDIKVENSFWSDYFSLKDGDYIYYYENIDSQLENKRINNKMKKNDKKNYLLFERRLFSKYYWIPFSKKLGNNTYENVNVKASNKEKATKIINQLKNTDMKDFIELFFNEEIVLKSKINYITTLGNCFDEQNKKRIYNKISIVHSETEYIQLANIIIELHKILFERLNYIKNQLKYNLKNVLKDDISEYINIHKKKIQDKINEKSNEERIIYEYKNDYCWILDENKSKPEKMNKEEINFKDEDNDNALNKIRNNFKLNKEPFEFPDLENLSSIDDFINMFKKLTLISQAFPLFIHELDELESSEIFNKLYSIYIDSNNYKKSIICVEKENFDKAFIDLCSLLHQNGVDLKIFEDIKLRFNEIKNDLKLYNNPEPNYINIRPSSWATKKDRRIKMELKNKNIFVNIQKGDNNFSETLIKEELKHRKNLKIKPNFKYNNFYKRNIENQDSQGKDFLYLKEEQFDSEDEEEVKKKEKEEELKKKILFKESKSFLKLEEEKKKEQKNYSFLMNFLMKFLII